MSRQVTGFLASALLTSTPAWAGAMYESPLSSCSTINCGGQTIRGIHQDSEPFVIQVFARSGECIRLDVSTQTEDVAMMMLGTTVNAFLLNDDRDFDGGDLRPLIAVDDLVGTGWYTVAISYFDIDDELPEPLVAKFTLEYGRYPTGNINCTQAIAGATSMMRFSESVNKMFGPATGNLEVLDRR
jgi:hypothetical protein